MPINCMPLFQSVKDCATATGLGQHYIRDRIHAGTCPYITVGKKYLVNVPAFLELLTRESEARNG